MQSLRNLLSRVVTRRYAQVHDITIKADNRILGSMERNVFRQPLSLHSTKPLTGFMRTGYCEAPSQDAGNHSIAGIVTNEFLDFSAARGNDLRQAGLTDGCDNDKKVPKIVLKATNERALEGLKMDDLKKFAVDKE